MERLVYPGGLDPTRVETLAFEAIKELLEQARDELAALDTTIAGLQARDDAPQAVITRTALQTLATGADTQVQFDLLETDSGHAMAVAGNDQLTIVKDGLYAVHAQCVWAANGAGLRKLQITKNGALNANGFAGATIPTAGAGASTRIPLYREVALVEGDTLQLMARQDSGGNLNIVQSDALPIVLGARWLRD